MITAKEARALAKESMRKRAARRYEPLIRKAAEDGLTFISLDYRISGLEEEALRELGYNVKVTRFGDTISW